MKSKRRETAPMAALSETVRHIRRIAEVKGLRDSTDREVLARFTVKRSEAAFAELVRRHGPMVFTTCRRVLRDEHDAEDVCQAVFLVLARKARSIRQRDSIAGWLYQVAYRLALRARTAADRRQRQLRLIADTTAAKSPGAGVVADVAEEVQRLPQSFRAALVLCYLEGRTQAEAAQLLGTTVDAVNSRLKRARDLLRERLVRGGVVVAGPLLMQSLSSAAVEAALSPRLARVTVEAALSFITYAGAPVSPVAVALARGAMYTMLIQKLKGLSLIAAALVVVSAATFLLAGSVPKNERQAVGQTGTGGPGQPVPGKTTRPKTPAAARRPVRSCIVLWMGGGPSQIDTFDPKPGVANGGSFRAIKTTIKDVEFCEHLPLLAQQAKHLTVIRSLSHKEGDHGRSSYLMRTGHSIDAAVTYPAFPCVLAKELGESRPNVPCYIAIGSPPPFAPVAFKAGFLGSRYEPVTVRPVRGFGPDSIALPPANVFERQAKGKGEELRKHVAKAFDLGAETQEVRAAYGPDPFGQGCLLARRLVEAGVPVVEVHLDGWDTHQDNFTIVQKRSLILDSAFGTLVKDLHKRKRLDSTLIVCLGEFGRTPRINAQMGRDHWPRSFSVVLAGCGLRPGQVIGETAADGDGVVERPVTPAELLATIYRALGVDPAKEYVHDDSKTRLLPAETKAVAEALR